MLSKAGEPQRGPSQAVVQALSLLFAGQIRKGAEVCQDWVTLEGEHFELRARRGCLSFWRWVASLAIGFVLSSVHSGIKGHSRYTKL